MKKTFEVLWAASAERDLLGIVEYIAAEDPQSAHAVLDRIEKAAARLKTLPKRGRGVPELLQQGISRYRELIIKPWRLVYRIEEEGRVFVVTVIDGRRNVEDLLLERLL